MEYCLLSSGTGDAYHSVLNKPRMSYSVNPDSKNYNE